ncbi:MAG: hypothetical protein FJW29_03905 [Acidobacteria bacterium]|nr:hypothetical protein [Acidobacteriota bacterium]
MRVSRQLWVPCLLGMLASACQPTAAPPTAAATLDDLARRYVALTQALALHDRSLIDHWLVPAPAAAPRQPIAPLLADTTALRQALEAVPVDRLRADEAWRGRYLQGQARSLHLHARRLAGATTTFAEEARDGLGVTRAEPRATDAAAHRATVARLVPGAAPLAMRVATWMERFRVPETLGQPFFRVALAACQSAARPALGAAVDGPVDVTFVEGLPWDAHARRSDAGVTAIEVRAGPPLTLTRALRLACHEGAAGHQAQYAWRAARATGPQGWPELALVPGFGPDLLLAEGGADAALSLTMPLVRRVEIYRTHLRPLLPSAARPTDAEVDRLVEVEEALQALEPIIGDVAAAYLDGTLGTEAALVRLTDEALVADAEGMLRFIEQRRSRVLAYTLGRHHVRSTLGVDDLASLRAVFPPAP